MAYNIKTLHIILYTAQHLLIIQHTTTIHHTKKYPILHYSFSCLISLFIRHSSFLFFVLVLYSSLLFHVLIFHPRFIFILRFYFSFLEFLGESCLFFVRRPEHHPPKGCVEIFTRLDNAHQKTCRRGTYECTCVGVCVCVSKCVYKSVCVLSYVLLSCDVHLCK